MKTFIKIIGGSLVTLGVFVVIVGIGSAILVGDGKPDSLSIVVGGGLFLGLGLAFFCMSKNK